MQRNTAISLIKRALAIVENQMPEMAEAHMQVPLGYYSSAEWAAKERALFETSPLALVAACEIAKPYDYLVRNALGRSILLTRDGDGVAHAFLNYCRHRGAETAHGCGNARAFACPYHNWIYDIRGQLMGMPFRDQYKGLNLSEYGLVELPSEERHGFIWVVLTPQHEIDVASHLGALDAEIGSLGCAKMSYYSSLAEQQLETNWKAVSEGLLEGLHVPYVHPGTFSVNPQAARVDLGFYDAIGPHIRYGLPIFGKEDVERIRAMPEASWNPAEIIGCIWYISPGLLLAHERYGLIYADLCPGATISEATFRYGWLSPVSEPPPGQPTPVEMAARAARGVHQDRPIWAGCERGLTRGAHGYALIGRNEKGVQMFHEELAKKTGYDGLHYC